MDRPHEREGTLDASNMSLVHAQDRSCGRTDASNGPGLPRTRLCLRARGLGAAYSVAMAAWRLGRPARLTALARYLVPGYLILARK